ncbi:unnamed protein product [Euphydryas editha]|nr:unnamed protein product [Euphydryas editha]
MSSPTESPEGEVLNTLPPMVINNTRIKLKAEQVSIIASAYKPKKKQIHDQRNNIERMQPQPIYPLKLVYLPKELYLEIDNATIVHNLRVWNASMRSLYVSCTGFYDKSEHLGASCCYHPRTRSLLAPGLATDFYIKAVPKNFAPVRSLRLVLQLAAAYKRDNVIIYFSVPIVITFLKFIPPCLHGEGG